MSNWKGKKYSSPNNQSNGNNNLIVGNPKCKTFGCNKILNNTEYLWGEYCFSCQSKINQNYQDMYKAILYKWNYQLNLWERQREIKINIDQFIKYFESDELGKTNNPFYKYDIIYKDCVQKCVYNHSPNLFD